jgi:hypothetical protein
MIDRLHLRARSPTAQRDRKPFLAGRVISSPLSESAEEEAALPSSPGSDPVLFLAG